MVGKKVTKVTAKTAVEVKTIDALKAELATKQSDLLEAKRGHRQGELANTCVLRSTRKEIARLFTAIKAMTMASEKENK